LRVRGLIHTSVLVGAAVLVTAAVASTAVVIAGSTVLAVQPSTPRDRVVPLSLPTEGRPLRVTVLGTSLISPSRHRWPDQLAGRLGERLGLPVEVTRVTRSGATSVWGEAQVGVVVAGDPDLVLVELAVNDADVRDGLSIESSVERHEAILRGLRHAHPSRAVVLLTMNPASGPRSWTRPFLSRYYAEYVDLAQRCDVGLVDLYARWLTLPTADRDLVDGLHPTDATASRMIVDPVVDALEEAVVR